MTVSLDRDYKFPRELRLLAPDQFSFVFDKATPAGSSYFTFLARVNPSLEYPRLGITIAKKRVKKAVQRNRIKRLLRESFRHNAHTIGNLDIVVLAKSGCDSLSNKDIHSISQQSLHRLKKKCGLIKPLAK